jgi:hypothetical protein
LPGALQAGGVGQLAAALPAASRAVLFHSYRSGFASAFGEITLIAAVVALVGSFFAYLLVRPQDFVPTGAPVTPPEETREAVAA